MMTKFPSFAWLWASFGLQFIHFHFALEWCNKEFVNHFGTGRAVEAEVKAVQGRVVIGRV